MKFLKEQALPLSLTLVIFLFLSLSLSILIKSLNLFTNEKISLTLRFSDIFVGLVIYLKTSVDFAIFIGNLMHSNPGWKKRIAIETGTALGNALGTFLILIIWTFFKEINWLLSIMVVIASIVLFRLAQDGLVHAKNFEGSLPTSFKKTVLSFNTILTKINLVFKFFSDRLLPHKITNTKALYFLPLLFFALSIPFILGLDDFAGYVALFNVVNVFGFAVGVFAGHAILNALLFISPQKTITLVKNPYISFGGSVAFVGIGFWGLFEASKIIFEH